MTIVLVHGALAGASVWHRVVPYLLESGMSVTAPALPLRSLEGDVAYLRAFLETIPGDIVVAAHSYGGAVISDPRALTDSVRALLFVAAFQMDTGETAGELNERFPGSGLTPENLVVRAYPGGNEVYLDPHAFRSVYAADVDETLASAMSTTQRPIDPTALGQAFSGQPTWKALPSHAVIPRDDRSIPTQTLRYMADRAKSVVVELDGSHAIPVSRPMKVAQAIVQASTSIQLTR